MAVGCHGSICGSCRRWRCCPLLVGWLLLVGAHGSSWWGRSMPPGPCSFCGRSREECERLIAGPGVFICDRCVALATGLSAGAAVEGRSAGPMRLEPPGSEVRCSFCGKEARRVRRLVASRLAATPGGKFGQERTRFCDECLDLCGEILAETSSP
jgi:hypothetical protein